MGSRLALSVLLALLTYHAAQSTDSTLSYRDDEHFLSWCAKFCGSEEDEYRARIYPTWRENADYVQKHNALGLSYSLSLNGFAHLVSLLQQPLQFYYYCARLEKLVPQSR